jgi:hypothetical protein
MQRLLWNPKVQCHVRKSPPWYPILSQMNPVHKFSCYFFNIILRVFFHLRPGLTSGLFPSGFPIKILYALLMRATYPTHRILLDLLTLIVFGEAWKLWSSSLCNILQLASTFYLSGPNILLSIPKDQRSEQNGSKHSANFVSSYFLLGWSLDFLLSFPSALTLPHFGGIYYVLDLHYG